jgi:diguanylate cyclase (GGDEF)-like protein
MRRLMLALQYREPAIVQHSRRVAALSVAVGQSLGWETRDLHALEAASLLHDVGKIGIPDIILQKPGPLSPDESELMGLQYQIASDVLQACGASNDVVQIAAQAQFHFNGAGQNFSVIGSDVHQGARILAVTDAYDSLTTQQYYREAYTHEKAMDVLYRASGSQFDGNVISALARWFEYNGQPQRTDDTASQYQLKAEEVVEAGSLSHVFSYLYLVESMYHGFHVAGGSAGTRVWNSGCEELTGISWQEARQHANAFGLIKYRDRFGETLPDHQNPLLLAAESGRAQTMELQLHRADGEWLPVEVQTLPLIDQSGQLKGYAEIFRDMSGKREAGGYRDLRLMASRDALTHVANRGELRKQLDRQIADYQARDCQNPFSIIFLDVDNFKNTNDTYGHAAGDEVLISVSRLLQHETYSGELVARYGGEEFVIVCPETTLTDGFQKAERLRAALENAQVVKADEFRITASFGVAEFERDDTAETVVQRADKALYMSKRQGRNQTSRLTSEELRRNDVAMVEPPVTTNDEFVYDARLKACIAADMIIYKLRAFVDGHGAKLGEVTQEQVVINIGQRSLFSMWGTTPGKQPVKVTLVFGDRLASIQRGANRLVEISVSIEPRGRAKDVDAFRKRSRAIIKDLREYLAADFADYEDVTGERH